MEQSGAHDVHDNNNRDVEMTGNCLTLSLE